MGKLEAAYNHLKALPFPPHSQSDGLDEWILELSETDGHFAGLAQTVLAGGRIAQKDVSDLSSLFNRLKSICVESPGARAVYAQCQEYIQALDAVREALLQPK